MRLGFAMPQVSGRRADQFGNLMAVLKLGAVDLDHRARIAYQRFRHGFHRARFARAGGPEEEQASGRPSRARHARDKGLVDIDDLANGVVLTDNPLPQIRLRARALPAPSFAGSNNILKPAIFLPSNRLDAGQPARTQALCKDIRNLLVKKRQTRCNCSLDRLSEGQNSPRSVPP